MIPFAYAFRNIIVRWRTTLLTATGFTLVVATLIIMLAFVSGVRQVCTVSGRPDNVIVLAQGNSDEVVSQIDEITFRRVAALPSVMQTTDGNPICSPELFMAVTRFDSSQDQARLLQLRGVREAAFQVHSQARLIAGRMFRTTERELIVGAATGEDLGVKIGDSFPIGGTPWKVVGVFAAAGSTFESEVWCSLDQLADQFNREGHYSSIIFRTRSARMATETAETVSADRQLNVSAQPETEYYAKQAEQMNTINAGAYIIATFMAIGAVFALSNTMFAAIGERTKDIAVMRLIGFARSDILISFLAETMVIACLGGSLGILAGYAVNGLSLQTALGDKSIVFAFRVDPAIIAAAACFSLLMGAIGGLLPAWSAMRIDPLESMQ